MHLHHASMAAHQFLQQSPHHSQERSPHPGWTTSLGAKHIILPWIRHSVCLIWKAAGVWPELCPIVLHPASTCFKPYQRKRSSVVLVAALLYFIHDLLVVGMQNTHTVLLPPQQGSSVENNLSWHCQCVHHTSHGIFSRMVNLLQIGDHMLEAIPLVFRVGNAPKSGPVLVPTGCHASKGREWSVLRNVHIVAVGGQVIAFPGMEHHDPTSMSCASCVPHGGAHRMLCSGAFGVGRKCHCTGINLGFPGVAK